MTRFTGVMCLEGGPIDHKYYEAYQELVSYIQTCKNINLSASTNEIFRKINEGIPDPKWRHIFL